MMMKPQTIEIAKAYIEAKGALSYSAVGRKFGVTRNTVAGAVHRFRHPVQDAAH